MRRPLSDVEKADMRQRADLLEDLARRMRDPTPDRETIDAGAGQLEQWAREIRKRAA